MGITYEPLEDQEMRELSSTITTKGQVTIPIEVRRLLGVQAHDQLAFVVEGDKVEIKRKASVVGENGWGASRPPSHCHR
jgi:AbrB family looped-hinge helix DNA binding protein